MVMLKRLLFALCILLLAVGVVSAADNITEDIVSMDDDVSLTVNDNNDAGIIAGSDQPVKGDVYDYGVSIEDDIVTRSSSANARVMVSGPDSESGNSILVSLKVYTLNDKLVKSVSKSVGVNEWSNIVLTGLVNGEYRLSASINNGLQVHSVGLTVNAPVKKLVVSAPAVKVTKGSSKYFKVTVKKGNSPVKGLKFKVKVLTGKKVKTYTVKTNKYGVAKFNVKKLKLGTHKVKVVSSNKKYKFSKSSKIKVVKKSNLKHFTLKLIDSSFYPDKKRIGKDVVVAWSEEEEGRQSKPGVYVEANYIPDGRSLPKHIKLVKGKFYFSTYMGKDKVITVKAETRGSISGKLYKDYTPYKVVVYYKKV